MNTRHLDVDRTETSTGPTSVFTAVERVPPGPLPARRLLRVAEMLDHRDHRDL